MVTIDGSISHVALSLAQIQSFDPQPRMSGGRQRFSCLLCRSAGRHLAVDDATGRWRCWRCQAFGIVRERWPARGESSRLALATAFGSATEASLASRTLAERRQAAPEPSRPTDESWWRRYWDGARPLAGTPGADYLASRGIPLEVAEAHDVRYGRRFLQARACILFPFLDRDRSAIVAVNARYLDGQTARDKTQTAGPRSLGAFWSPAALERKPVVVVEGPMDMLSLAVAGIPSLALVGTSGTSWLPEACAGKQVAVALDNDERGEDGSLRFAQLVAQAGGWPFRCRPTENDWNDVLLRHGVAALRSCLGAPTSSLRCVRTGCTEWAVNGFVCAGHLGGEE
jgi:hypothetical protein